MPLYDYHCAACCPEGGAKFIDRHCPALFELLVSLSLVQSSGVPANSACPDCGGDAPRVWVRAPGVLGEENVPREQLAAARSGFVRHGKGVPEFRGSTRSELHAWERQHNLIPMQPGERRSGRFVLPTKPKFSETPAFRKILDEAREIARDGEGAVRAELELLEQPDEFDRNAYAAQVGAGVDTATGDERTNQAAADIAAELASNQ